MIKQSKDAARFLRSLGEKGRFIVVGFINTATDFSVLNFLVFAFGVPLYGANLISTFLAMSLSLVLNKRFVFKQGARISLREFFTFIGVTLVGLWGVQTVVIFLLVQQFPLPLSTIAATIHDSSFMNTPSIDFIVNNGAKVLATGASLVWNYLLYKYVVFDVPKPKGEPA